MTTQHTEEEKERILIQVKEELDKEKARKQSIKEGKYAAISQGAGHSYISPFALALGATNPEIGILSSLPWILNPLAQMYGSSLIEKRTRREVVIRYVLISSLIWIIISILAFLIYLNKIPQIPITFILIYLTLVFISNISLPGWFSWMGDLVPEKKRGKYFSRRNRITGSIALTTMLIASFFLDYFKTKGLLILGFSILFFISGISRLVSANLFRGQYEPKLKVKKKDHISLINFLKNISKHNFGKFTIFMALIQLTHFIAAPFFVVYMIRTLNFSYFWFTTVTLSTSLFNLMFLPIWGKFSDHYGNKTLLKIGLFLIPLNPIFWIFSSNPYYLIFIPQFIAGLGWGAINLSSNNFIYDSIEPERRARFISYYNLLLGIGILGGGLIGSLIIERLPINFMNIFLFIFLLSGILRGLVAIIGFKHIKEVRKVKKPRKLTKAIIKEIKPVHFTGLIHELITLKNILPMISINNYKKEIK